MPNNKYGQNWLHLLYDFDVVGTLQLKGIEFLLHGNSYGQMQEHKNEEPRNTVISIPWLFILSGMHKRIRTTDLPFRRRPRTLIVSSHYHLKTVDIPDFFWVPLLDKCC